MMTGPGKYKVEIKNDADPEPKNNLWMMALWLVLMVPAAIILAATLVAFWRY